MSHKKHVKTQVDEKWKSLSDFISNHCAIFLLSTSIALPFFANFNPIWHVVGVGVGGGHFYPLVLVGSNFVSRIFFKNFQTFFKNFQAFLEVKIDINRVILTPCPAH